jgi:hypothetical protein
MCRCSHRPGRSADPADGPLARVDLINPVSRSTALNAAEMSVNQPNSTWSLPQAFCRFPGLLPSTGRDAVSLAMQKVEGSSPFSRLQKSPAHAGFFLGLHKRCRAIGNRISGAHYEITTRTGFAPAARAGGVASCCSEADVNPGIGHLGSAHDDRKHDTLPRRRVWRDLVTDARMPHRCISPGPQRACTRGSPRAAQRPPCPCPAPADRHRA